MVVIYVPLAVFEYKAHRNIYIGPYFSINKVYGSAGVDADLLIMGNSRADEHYDDALIGDTLGLRCYNIGCHGNPIEFQYHVMLKAYLNRNTKPKYVLLDISPFSMFKYLSSRRSFEFLPYLSRPEFSYYINSCRVFKPCDRLLLPRYAGVMYQVFKGLQSFNTVPAPKSEAYQPIIMNEPVPLEQEAENIAAFYDFIGYCIDNGMKLILVCSPMHEDHYCKYVDMDAFWKQVDEAVDGRNVTVLDYATLYGSDTRYFHDLLHLNKFGRTQFSKTIAHDLKAKIK